MSKSLKCNTFISVTYRDKRIQTRRKKVDEENILCSCLKGVNTNNEIENRKTSEPPRENASRFGSTNLLNPEFPNSPKS